MRPVGNNEVSCIRDRLCRTTDDREGTRMHRFKKIMFVADGDNGEKAALSRAIELAEANDANLTLMELTVVQLICPH